jgi:hypothetical protein
MSFGGILSPKFFRKVFAFFIVLRVDNFCVCSLSDNRKKLINKLSIVTFLSEAEVGAVVLSTLSPEEQLNTCNLSRLFFLGMSIFTVFNFLFFLPKLLQQLP